MCTCKFWVGGENGDRDGDRDVDKDKKEGDDQSTVGKNDIDGNLSNSNDPVGEVGEDGVRDGEK